MSKINDEACKQKCKLCNTYFPVDINTLKKKLKFAKGHVVKGRKIRNYKIINYGFLNLRTKTEITTIRTIGKCKQNIYDSFFICPICKSNNYIQLASPCFIGNDLWHTKKEKVIEIVKGNIAFTELV